MMGSSESSVAVSLRELMQLEHDRVVAEESAVRVIEARAAEAAREAARARSVEVECARTLERARERDAEEAAARRREAHEVAMLRVRWEVEAQERAERERLALEHQRALRRLDLDVRSRRLVRALAVLLVTGVAAVALGYGVVVEPALRAAVDREAHARRIADEQFAENAALSHRLREAEAKMALAESARPAAAKAGAMTATPPVTTAPQLSAKVRNVAKRPHSQTPIAREEDVLGDLDDESDDPIHGAIDPRRTGPLR